MSGRAALWMLELTELQPTGQAERALNDKASQLTLFFGYMNVPAVLTFLQSTFTTSPW